MSRLFRARRVLSYDSSLREARDIRVEGDRIVAVGRLRPRNGESVVDLAGATLMPGLWDSHIHLLLWGLKLGRLNLDGCVSLADMLARVGEEAGRAEGWLLGQGWNECGWPEGRLPSRQDLDAVCPDRPVLLHRQDLHSAVVNSAALRLAGYDRDTPDPDGGRLERDVHGDLTGILRELAITRLNRVMPSPGPVEVAAALRRAEHALHRLGITGVVDQRLKSEPDLSGCLSAYQRLHLKLRIQCNLAPADLDFAEAMGLCTGFGNDWLRLSHVKFFSDGSLGSQTAIMHAPYCQSEAVGLWLTPPEELQQGFARAHQLGFPVSVHAIGDRAVTTCLDLLRERPQDLGIPDRIEHVQILAPQDLERPEWARLVASMQPGHILDDREVADRLLGDRANRYYRLRSLSQRTTLVFGSDAPVSDPSPWVGLQAAVQRRVGSDPPWYPDERLDLDAALKAYTRDAAATLGRPDLGVLHPGSQADFVAVSPDPRESEQDLTRVAVQMTVVGGEIVYCA